MKGKRVLPIKECYAGLVIRIFEGDPGDLFPITAHDIFNINQALSTLSPREQEILELRFGLKDGATKSLKGVGLAMGRISPERIRQIEGKALRKLRRPKNVRLMGGDIFFRSSLIRQIEELYQKNIDMQNHLKNMQVRLEEHMLCKEKDMLLANPLFAIPMDECEFSIRTHNCLIKDGIRIIYELVQRTEHELMGIRYFGIKSLEEVKQFLTKRGLKLGMRLP